MSFAHLPYRPCAGICLVNRDRLIFAAKRIDNPIDAWQMPQGGIDKGEVFLKASTRELQEETGVTANKVEMLSQTRDWLQYDLPKELLGKIWGGKYRGQRQKWVCYHFLGSDEDINIAQDHPEFSEWKWMRADDIIGKIVPFKRALYQRVLHEFRDFLR